MADHIGNTRVVLDESGNVKSYYDYYPYGKLQRASVAGLDARYKFTGKEHDDEGGLNWTYFGARYYDPEIGRFLSVDPLAEEYPSLSPYCYVANNPMILVDPDGMAIGFGGQESSPFNYSFSDYVVKQNNESNWFNNFMDWADSGNMASDLHKFFYGDIDDYKEILSSFGEVFLKDPPLVEAQPDLGDYITVAATLATMGKTKSLSTYWAPNKGTIGNPQRIFLMRGY